MALPSNLKQQLVRRMKQELSLIAPAYKAVAIDDVTFQLVDAADAVAAIIMLKSKSFNGFNILHELSASAGEGQPETELWIEFDDSLAKLEVAKLTKVAAVMGCACIKVLEGSTPAVGHFVDANVLGEIPNSGMLGAVGV